MSPSQDPDCRLRGTLACVMRLAAAVALTDDDVDARWIGALRSAFDRPEDERRDRAGSACGTQHARPVDLRGRRGRERTRLPDDAPMTPTTSSEHANSPSALGDRCRCEHGVSTTRANR